MVLFFCGTAQAAGYDPAWAAQKPLRQIAIKPAPDASATQNGAALVQATAALQPGDRLEVGAGTYSMSRRWDLQVSGTAQAPVWIEAAKDAHVIITRPDNKQNVLNVGPDAAVRFLCLRGLEFTGGSHGLRLGLCSQVWIDGCHIHHTDGVCLSANTADTSHLYLTRCHIHHGARQGEGMYLGANNAQHIMSHSVIALNHIHDCRGEQGDGIEVKQGSWGNLIAENHVHDCQYPCITVYGTGGRSVNVIERNLCYNSADSVMQVQGEAIVRNNVLINGLNSGFASTDHQGQTLNLHVIHNTIINSHHAFRGGSWNARQGMVLANNVLYSRDAHAFHFANGNSGVSITGNVVLGEGPTFDSSLGHGLEDFENVTWDATQHNTAPANVAPFNHADAEYQLGTDFFGEARTKPTSGAIAH